MVGALLGLLRPAWVKAAVVGALCVGSFWAGVRWESAESNARWLAAERQQAAELERLRDENAQRLADQERARRAIERRLIDVRKETTLERDAARERIRTVVAAADACRIDLDRERVWRLNNGEGGAGVPEAGAAAGGSAELAGTCTEADLYTNHADLVARYRELSARHSALQGWARSALATCNGGSVEGAAP